jgi:threonine aldolase
VNPDPDSQGLARPRHFASDNNSGVCPEAAAALAEANTGHVIGYGDDCWTARACGLIRDFFETNCEVFLVFNGTAANALGLAACCQPFHAVLCHEFSHIHRDECNAPGFFSGGAMLIPLPGLHARLEPSVLEERIASHFPLHASRPAAVSLTESTECGTTYRAAEIEALADVARRHRLKVHMDGARLANAIAFLGATPAELTWRAGVDVLSFGMTKNGGLCTEAIVVFDTDLARELDYRAKQAGQLGSKMRYLAASWIGLLESGTWLKNARHANEMASLLETAITKIPGIYLLHPREANGVFVHLPPDMIHGLHEKGWHFYVFEGATGCRLMCSWDTTPEDIDEFAADAALLAQVERAPLPQQPEPSITPLVKPS